MAVIGDRIFISLFGLIGAERFRVESEEEVASTISDLIKKGIYSVIILPERYVNITREIRFRLITEGKAEPIFAFVPEKGVGERVKELENLVNLAIGLKLEI